MTSPAHPIYISDDDDVHEVIIIPDPEIFNVSDDEAEVEPDVLEANDESQPESDYEEDPEEMTDVEHEAPEPEDDPEVVVDEEPEAPMEAEPEMEDEPEMEAREADPPPSQEEVSVCFWRKGYLPPPPSPKRERAADIVEDGDTSDEEPPSTFEVGGTSQPPLPVTADLEPEDVDPPTLAVRCEMYDHQLDGNENGGGSGGGNGNGTGNTSGAGGSGTRGEDTNGNQLTLASSLERSLLMIIMF
ncbi:hypothetical protein L1987_18659 [Smallanthus sonchifolius]|uniref:Uncharacterized protein n=1 Tax=Smallanthus sonchifolius TaxID=185202 RepID=A0ACB9J073_9ASTR|nr:hypothetical protein L1987_18659 [Smallanthus sonchifolius]